MRGGSFLDSNILIYTDDRGSPAKQKAAIALVTRLMRAGSAVLSLQVLQEYFAIVTRKLGVEAVVARGKVELFGGLTISTTDIDDVLAAIDLHRLHQLAFWDALIVRSAVKAGCGRIYTEDLQHGRRFDGVEIVNPFIRPAPPGPRG